MSDQLFERAVRDWLEDGSDRTPPPAIDAVLLAVRTTPQERGLRIPRRFTSMPTSLRLAAAVAVVAIAGVGALLFVGSETPPPFPTAAPTASPGPSPAPTLGEGPLLPGRYRYDGTDVRVTVTVPAGWRGFAFGVSTGLEGPVGANLLIRQPTLVFGDPCAPEGAPQLLGPTVDDLVTALSDLPNVTASPPADVTISGYSGTRLTFVVDTESVDCVMGLYREGSFIRSADNGQHQDLWILDVAGTRLVIDAAIFPDTTAEVRTQLQRMVDTLVIEPTG